MSIWSDKLKKIIADLDQNSAVPTPAKRIEVAEELEKMEPLFNIHKRTLPVELDVPVMWGLTLEEATQAIRRLTEQEKKHPSTNQRFVVYYDSIAQSASEAERSVYYNSVRPMIDVIRGGEIQ